ncbi:hypothetical protein OQE91_003737 [Escherichia coli]|nr:hypothetical protein [Escherichia coli]EKY5908506.1 hypothetical protein [Escherichia coli]EKY5937093.1 hypothetical protein [Escherichia coli]EKY5999989.1 hypothetical protein [Escherichia coli]EKY6078725.1 hypothetical protein [Escherichia coli]
MKKTLIAMIVTTFAAVSGSAMAWTANGSGGNVDLGGTLTPVEKATPWEVKVGTAMTGLDAQIQKGQTNVDIPVKEAIQVLGIRTQSARPFHGLAGIAPQIDFNGHVDIDGFKAGLTTVRLDINDDTGSKIGTMESKILAAGVTSYRNAMDAYNNYLIAPDSGDAFYGGIYKSDQYTDGLSERILNVFGSELNANYDNQNSAQRSASKENYIDENATFSAYYGSGIESGQLIAITLDQPASGDAPIAWKASLPVTVFYQ